MKKAHCGRAPTDQHYLAFLKTWVRWLIVGPAFSVCHTIKCVISFFSEHICTLNCTGVSISWTWRCDLFGEGRVFLTWGSAGITKDYEEHTSELSSSSSSCCSCQNQRLWLSRKQRSCPVACVNLLQSAGTQVSLDKETLQHWCGGHTFMSQVCLSHGVTCVRGLVYCWNAPQCPPLFSGVPRDTTQ